MTKNKIGIVGPCGAGKSTLADHLKKDGFHVTHIAQEHSYVPEMWAKIACPDILLYLNVSFDIATKRKKISLSEREFNEQIRRLRHARQHADLVVETDKLTIDDVYNTATSFLGKKFT